MSQEETIAFSPVNRSAVTIHVKQPFLDWVMKLPDLEPGETYTLESINDDNDVLLVPDFETPDEIQDYVDSISPAIFEQLLEDWCDQAEFWPKNRNIEMFDEWFEVKVHSLVTDVDGFEKLGTYE